jgi:hypothetical protein
VKVTFISSKGVHLGMPEERNKPLSVACNCLLFWSPTNPSKGRVAKSKRQKAYLLYLQYYLYLQKRFEEVKKFMYVVAGVQHKCSGGGLGLI